MIIDPIVISMFTPEYEPEVAPFVEAVRAQGLKEIVYEVPSLGTWRDNVGQKPYVIRRALQRVGAPIVFIDIDGRVRGVLPILHKLVADWDFAARFILNKARYRPGGKRKRPPRALPTILSGTLWFNYTPAALKFLELWEGRECGQYLLGQIVLSEVWHNNRPAGLRTYSLPADYCRFGHCEGAQITHDRGAKRYRGTAGGFTQLGSSMERMLERPRSSPSSRGRGRPLKSAVSSRMPSRSPSRTRAPDTPSSRSATPTRITASRTVRHLQRR